MASKYYIFFSFLFFSCIQGNAQTAAAFELAGDEAFARKDYNAAIQYYSEANEKDAKNIEVIWKIAETARNYNSYSLAEKNYQKVAKSTEAKKYPMTNYWIALMKKASGNYLEAKGLFKEVYDDGKNISDEYINQAKKEIKSCDWALGVINSPKDVTIEHLGKNVNSPYSEFGAVKRNDTLFFSSLRFENKNDNRNPPRLITKILSTPDTTTAKVLRKFNAENQHTASLAFSQKTNKVVFCQCEYVEQGDEIRCDLYERTRQASGEWSNAEKLPEFINMQGSSNTQPHIAMDKTGQEILYFVSNRKDGKGKFDIWYSTIFSSGNYAMPINLASINTRGDEMTPFFHVGNNTLYFSSDGYETLGGLDVFSALKKGNVFDTPKNMGVPLNSSYHDFYLNISANGKEGYFSSNRVGSLFLDKKNETCCYDIYKAKFGEEILKVKKEEPKKTTTSTIPKTATDKKTEKDPSIPKTTNIDKPKGNTPEIPNNQGVTPPSKNNVPPKNGSNITTSDKPKNNEVPKTLEGFLPLPLFFDNDEPDNNTWSTSTKKTYEQSFISYYAKKLLYMEKCGKGKSALQKIEEETKMMKYFEDTIKLNFNRLQQFTPILLSRLFKGENIEIIVKGFASPLAKNDYNNNLGKRRVASLYNFWNNYENGIFRKYFDNGQLKLTQVSYGEETASKQVSDNQRDEAASIFSLGAVKERRIEIIEVRSSN